MPEEKPAIRKATPPPSGREPARARGPVTAPDAPDVLASTAPDDDLSDYVVPAEDPVPAPADTVPPAPGDNNVGPQPIPRAPEPTRAVSVNTSTTAETELVRQLQAELAAAQDRLAGIDADPSNWGVASAPVAPKDGDRVLIHVRKDGFTANGRVWYQGQELEFTVGEQNWKDTVDRNGNSWLTLSESDQIRRYGEIVFGHGPWPGASWSDARAANEEAQRGRSAPTITQISNVQTSRT